MKEQDGWIGKELHAHDIYIYNVHSYSPNCIMTIKSGALKCVGHAQSTAIPSNRSNHLVRQRKRVLGWLIRRLESNNSDWVVLLCIVSEYL